MLNSFRSSMVFFFLYFFFFFFFGFFWTLGEVVKLHKNSIYFGALTEMLLETISNWRFTTSTDQKEQQTLQDSYGFFQWRCKLTISPIHPWKHNVFSICFQGTLKNFCSHFACLVCCATPIGCSEFQGWALGGRTWLFVLWTTDADIFARDPKFQRLIVVDEQLRNLIQH